MAEKHSWRDTAEASLTFGLENREAIALQFNSEISRTPVVHRKR
jgi:hypothetical protein